MIFISGSLIQHKGWSNTGPAYLHKQSLWNFNTENHTENFRVTLKIHEIAQDKGIE